MDHKTFNVKNQTFRVVSRRYYESEYGYREKAENHYNELQLKRSFLGYTWWKTIERELIPSFAWISQACLGYSNWSSPLLLLINQQKHPIFIS